MVKSKFPKRKIFLLYNFGYNFHSYEFWVLGFGFWVLGKKIILFAKRIGLFISRKNLGSKQLRTLAAYFKDAISITKRYLISPFNNLS